MFLTCLLDQSTRLLVFFLARKSLTIVDKRVFLLDLHAMLKNHEFTTDYLDNNSCLKSLHVCGWRVRLFMCVCRSPVFMNFLVVSSQWSESQRNFQLSASSVSGSWGQNIFFSN